MQHKLSLTRAALVVFVLAFGGCFGKDNISKDPKQRLTDYISKSFSIKRLEDRNDLASFLTGEAKTRLLSWSGDQFAEAFMDSKREFLKLALREVKVVSPTEVGITYELTYVQDLSKKGGGKSKVTNRKLAQLVLEDQKWMIRDVHNINELVEYQNEMSLP